MPKRKRNNLGLLVGCIIAALAGLALGVTALVRGHTIALFDSRGTIAHEQRDLMITTVAILLAIAIPALFLAFFIAWKYRESNTKASREPRAQRSKLLVPAIWLAPTAVAVVLATIMWPAAHKLDPKMPIAAGAEPLTIQVISLRWKWVFIYPEQHIAAVNFVQVPVNRPVEFKLTADEAPMSSFWIPNLGGQLYSMTGHMNQLNLMADTPGDYTGSSAEINGAGFSGMKFTARASGQKDFDAWVNEVRLKGYVLDSAEYEWLLKPSEHNPAVFYSGVEDGLYDTVLAKYMGPAGSEGNAHMSMGMYE